MELGVRVRFPSSVSLPSELPNLATGSSSVALECNGGSAICLRNEDPGSVLPDVQPL
jgi:hypothetical protein